MSEEESYSSTSEVTSSENDSVKKAKKTKHSVDFLKEIMNPTLDELEYRKAKLGEKDVIEKSFKFFHCTKCKVNYKSATNEGKEVSVHPFLGVLMCTECCNFYGDGDFSLDSEGEDKYCRWCGEGGTIFTCSKCISGFCSICIKKHLGVDHLKAIEKDDNWLCFFCNPKPLWSLRFVCALMQQLTEAQKSQLINPISNNSNKSSSKISEKSSRTQENMTPDLKVQNSKEPSSTKNTSKNAEQAISTDSKKLTDTKCSKGKNLSKKINAKSKSLPIKRPLYNKNERDTISSTEKIKRAKYISESSDEEDSNNLKSSTEIEKDCNEKAEETVLNSSFSVLKSEIVEKMETILKLAEYQMAFGMNWISKSLRNLSDSKNIKTLDELFNEVEKTKWFLSLLSSHLVEFSESLKAVEKNLPNKEKTTQNIKEKVGDHSTELSSYADVLQFLGFIDKLVKVSAQNGFGLQDLIDSKIYNDNKVLGIIKKNNNLSSGMSNTQKKKKEKNPEESKSPHQTTDDSETDFEEPKKKIKSMKEKFNVSQKSEETIQVLKDLETDKNRKNMMDILEILENA